MANWDDIRVFLAVARAQSLSGAAPVLRMDPATLSRRITRLERDLGEALFVKSPQGYVLTGAGQRLQDQAGRAEQALSQIEVGPQEQSLSGVVRIGAPDGCANFLLPQVCARLQADHPDLEVQILALPRVVNLSRREADLAITVSPPNTKRLLSEEITAYHLHLAARLDCADKMRNLGDLHSLPMVGYIPDMIYDQELDYLSALPAADNRMASNSVSVQLQMLRATPSVGIVHDFALPFAPELTVVLRNEFALTRRFYLVHHEGDQRSARMMRLVTAVRDGVRAEVARMEAMIDGLHSTAG